MMILSVLFHCNGGENSLSGCSSSFVNDTLSCNDIAAVECGGITDEKSHAVMYYSSMFIFGLLF